jgi:hypothetical protein
MLYLMALLISFSSFSDVTPKLRDCMTRMFDRGGWDKSQQEHYRRWQGGQGAIDKKIRSFLGNAKPGDYSKHNMAKSIQEAIDLSKYPDKQKKNGNNLSRAQYMPGLSREKIERRALNPETPGFIKDDKGTMYKYVRFNNAVGFDGGKETMFMRVEISASGTFHGHPMSIDRVRGAIGDAGVNMLSPTPIRAVAPR